MIVRGDKPTIDKDKVKKILVIRLMSLGDIILSTPVLTALRAHFSQAEITMLVDKAYEEAVTGHPALNRVLAIPRAEMRKLSFFERVSAEWAWFKKVRDEKFDLVVDLQGTPRTAWLCLFSGIPVRVGGGHRRRGLAYNYRVIAENRYAVEVNLDYARAVGAEAGDKRIKLVIASQNAEYVERFLSQNNPAPAEPLIAFHIGGGWPAKYWPMDYFEQLGWMIHREKLGRVVLLQGPREKELVPELLTRLRSHGLDPLVAEGLTIQQTGALLQRCAALVSNDTGPMHMALALQVPVIGLFGQEIKDLWFPAPETVRDYTGYDQAVALQHKVWCSPCHLNECDRMECLKAITSTEVLYQLRKFMGAKVKG